MLFFIVLEVADVLLTTVLFHYSLNCYLPATLTFICSLLASIFAPKDIRSKPLSKNGLPNSSKAFFRWSTSLKK